MEFYADLGIYVAIIVFWVLVAAVFIGVIRLVWAVCDVISERTASHCREKSEKAARKAEYRRRQEEYRKECLGCYPRE